MDDQLKQAWLKGDAFSLELMLIDKNATDCISLFEYGSDDMDWKYKGRPVVARVLLEACIHQKIESCILERIGMYCYCVGEYGRSYNHTELRDLASWTANEAQKKQRINKDNCRKVIVTLLGCCGKQRRAEGGILKDVVPIIAKQVWRTRRNDLWK
jgi:hypothetical protein